MGQPGKVERAGDEGRKGRSSGKEREKKGQSVVNSGQKLGLQGAMEKP